mmetsp:Transcript_29742/g.86683  ORF Transcript_29742/g.86683 Transcript_29742/m.86683 type:complete len:227 (-) Transcript_29742:6081-6761(-)
MPPHQQVRDRAAIIRLPYGGLYRHTHQEVEQPRTVHQGPIEGTRRERGAGLGALARRRRDEAYQGLRSDQYRQRFQVSQRHPRHLGQHHGPRTLDYGGKPNRPKHLERKRDDSLQDGRDHHNPRLQFVHQAKPFERPVDLRYDSRIAPHDHDRLLQARGEFHPAHRDEQSHYGKPGSIVRTRNGRGFQRPKNGPRSLLQESERRHGLRHFGFALRDASRLVAPPPN